MKIDYLILSHRFVTNPGDELKEYLCSKGKTFLYIHHSFLEIKNRRSYLLLYSKGELIKSKQTINYIFLPETLIYLKEFFFTSLWIVLYGRKIKKAICLDGLCTGFAFFGKKIGLIKKICYWSIDFVPNSRFESKIKMFIYHFINKFGYKHADEMWDIAHNAKEAREKFINFPQNGYKSHKVVPNGCWVEKYPRIDYSDSLKHTLVFMGHIIPKQGVDQAIEAIPEIIKSVPNFKFRVIGGGAHRNQLEKRVKELKIENNVDFLGIIPDHHEMEKKISECALSIAPYNPKLDNFTYFADPGKVKVYIACGVPILVSDIVFHSDKIVKNKCGEVVRCDKKDIAEKVVKFLKDKKAIILYKKNCLKYAKTFDWKNIFDQALNTVDA